MQALICSLPHWLRNEFYWTTINRARRVRIAQVVIFYPVVAVALKVATKFHVPVPAFAKYLFVGMLLYSASLAIFHAFCPGPIKKYDTAIEYASAEVAHFSSMHLLLRRLVGNAERRLSEGCEKREVKRRFSAENVNALMSNKARLSVPQATVLMDYLWHVYDVTNPWARIAAAVSHWLGLAFITFPSVITAVNLSAGLFVRQ